jgi:HD-like signal output (HDOD) protein
VDCSFDPNLLRASFRLGTVPLPPTALRRALDLAGDERTNDDLLTAQIDSDRRLRYGFVACANLPMFSRGRPIKSVRQGAAELGRRKTVSLLWLLALSDFLQSWKKPEAGPPNRVWRHSLLTGVLAQQLVFAAGFEWASDALRAGLAHDIGHRLVAGPEPRLGIAGHEEHVRLTDQCISIAPEYDHCRMGAGLLEFWGAPAQMVSCALHHHVPEESPTGHRPLIVGVRLADLVAEHLELGRPAPALRLEAAPVWQQLSASEPFNQIAGLHHLAIERLPDSLVTAEHLARVLGE